jgi:drug/metabolite transporter (DMT)-like permease
MVEGAHGTGEAEERRKRRLKIAIVGSLFAVGMVSGFFVGHSAKGIGALLGPEPVMPPAVAIGLCLVFALAIGVGAVLMKKHADELERLNRYKAASLAGTVYLTAYMLWFFLWKGGLVPEPMHAVLFLIFLVSMFAGLAIYRFR